MAKQLGVDYNELAKGAIAASERTAAAAELMGRGLNLDEKQKEFITNISQMKDGKMQIELNSERLRDALGTDSTSIALENLTESQAATLLKYQEEFKTKTPEEIIRGQATDIQNIGRDVNSLLALARLRAGKLGEDLLKEMDKKTGISMAKISKTSSELADNAKKYVNEGDNIIRKEINKDLKTNLPVGKVSKITKDPQVVAQQAAIDAKNAAAATNTNNQNNNTNNGTTTKVDIQLSAKGPAYDYIEVGNKRSYTYQSTPQ
jgi:signal transduction histidine kinase